MNYLALNHSHRSADSSVANHQTFSSIESQYRNCPKPLVLVDLCSEQQDPKIRGRSSIWEEKKNKHECGLFCTVQIKKGFFLTMFRNQTDRVEASTVINLWRISWQCFGLYQQENTSMQDNTHQNPKNRQLLSFTKISGGQSTWKQLLTTLTQHLFV